VARIEFNNVSVDFPIYNANSRSLKSHLIKVATGGQLNTDRQGRVLVRALEGLTFTLQDGDRVGIIGHNGAGKSTLLRLLSGVYFPSGGSVKIDGEVGSLIDISLGIDNEATGRENVYIRGSLLGLSKAVINQNINEIIEFSELGSFADMPVRTYSSGMHLRLAFAVSTIVHPQILLMDEWLSVGDEGFKEKAKARLNALVHKTNILVIATHSREQLLQTCNRAIWLEHGKILMDDDTAKVAAAYFDRII
jgi:lipopolysaccharide transport system ATP-binding protein